MSHLTSTVMEALCDVEPSSLTDGRHPEILLSLIRENEKRDPGFIKKFVEYEMNLLSRSSEIWEFTQEVNFSGFSLNADEREMLRCSSILCLLFVTNFLFV